MVGLTKNTADRLGTPKLTARVEFEWGNIMNTEGLQRWIDAQVQALNPDSFIAQLALFAAVICGTLLVAAAARQLSQIFPLQRYREAEPQTAALPQMAAEKPIQPQAAPALKSTSSQDGDSTTFSTNFDLSSRQKKKFTKAKPKKFYANIEKAPSDPMFLPPFDTNVPYRDRLAMIGSGKETQA